MPQLNLRCVPFDLFRFQEEIRKASGATEEVTQVRYLAGYLGSHGLGAKTMLVESPYIDRHYIEEYSRYYATAFRSPKPWTVRIHFFTRAFTDAELQGWLADAATGNDARLTLQDRLQADYRGYIVVRPLASAPIGRSNLAVYSDKDSRRFVVQRHKAHLLGLELTVDGVPFQQQEVAVGACATTAMWSALTIAARATGRRGPTPYQVTEAATRHVLNDRPIPADAGLDLQQILAAVRECGFSPLTLKAHGNFPAFIHALKCYLSSNIPVVLVLHENGGYHAVTAVGFRMPDDEHTAEEVVFSEGDKVSIRTAGLTRVYVHDDRLGPYARYICAPENRLVARDDEDSSKDAYEQALTLAHEPYPEGGSDPWQESLTIYAAVIPLYPKLRLTVRGLLKVAGEIWPLAKALVAAESRDHIRIDLRFMLSGDYLAELLSASLDDPARVASFVYSQSLPRYVGVVRFSIDSGAVFDVLCDTTDIHRDTPKYAAILALFAFTTAYQNVLDGYSHVILGKPDVTG